MSAMTDTFENKLVDFLFRAQALGLGGATAAAATGLATAYVGLLSTNPTTDAGNGVEVSSTSTNYGRVAVASGLGSWKSTQNDALASTGTTGTISNAAVLSIGTSNSVSAAGAATVTTANVGTVGYTTTGVAVYDALTGGNMLFWAAFTATKTINAGDPVPTFAVGALTFQVDN